LNQLVQNHYFTGTGRTCGIKSAILREMEQLGMVFAERRPRSVSGGDLDLAQAHHGPLADVDPPRGGQEGRKGAGTDGKGERAGDTAQLDLGLLRPRVAHKVEPASLPG